MVHQSELPTDNNNIENNDVDNYHNNEYDNYNNNCDNIADYRSIKKIMSYNIIIFEMKKDSNLQTSKIKYIRIHKCATEPCWCSDMRG